MNFKKTMFALAVGSAGLMTSASALAFTLNNGDILTINAGAQATTVSGSPVAFATGSWFGMDTGKPIGSIGMGEQVLLSPAAAANTGIVIGQIQAVGAGTFYNGAPTGTENSMMSSWFFNSNTGINFTTSAITGGTDGLTMGGWRVAWAEVPSINMGTLGTGGTWVNGAGSPISAPTNCATIGMSCAAYTNGMAQFSWDGVYGSNYTLDYIAVVPLGDPSGFGGTQYALHLEGTVQAVPEASTYGMMLAGLGLVGFAVRRRKLI